jgi:predicted dehydrogenase
MLTSTQSNAMQTKNSEPVSRRQFIQSTGAALVAGSMIVPASARRARAAGTDLLKVGLIGCGGRGTGAAAQALGADQNVKLVAMADAFAEPLENSFRTLQAQASITSKLDVPPERRFAGFDGYKGVIEHSDVVLLATPPHFRPMHIKAAVDAGKHVFAEKPVAVDAPGVRSVLESCEEAKRKKLSIVSGLALRYSNGFRETMERIHKGALGELRSLQANDFRGPIWVKPRQPGWSDMEWQMRNWYYFTWLSGDFNVEQHVHYLDLCSWVLQDEYPVRAYGTGGRQVRTAPEYGNIYDHHSVIYEYASGVKLFAFCRQQPGCRNDISGHVMGEKGTADLNPRRPALRTRDGDWAYRGPENNHFETEHEELFASIRSGEPINNGNYMAKSTLLAIMGRMATYTGQLITWEQAFNSQEDLSPPSYEWGPLPVAPVAMPGVTSPI